MLGKIKVYGVGGEKQFVAPIEAGDAQATVGQDPVVVRRGRASARYSRSSPASICRRIEGIAAPVITKANAATYVAHW